MNDQGDRLLNLNEESAITSCWINVTADAKLKVVYTFICDDNEAPSGNISICANSKAESKIVKGKGVFTFLVTPDSG